MTYARTGAFVLMAAMACVNANAAGPFDGKWVGTAPEAGDCGQLLVTLVVADGTITGTVAGKHGAPPIESGRIATDGTAQLRYAGKQGFRANVKFVGDGFRGTFDTFCGTRATVGSRVPR
jgi:hypothetical protein